MSKVTLDYSNNKCQAKAPLKICLSRSKVTVGGGDSYMVLSIKVILICLVTIICLVLYNYITSVEVETLEVDL